MNKQSLRIGVVICGAALTVAATGCKLTLMQLGLLSGGGVVPPEYTGLEGKRVAVICVSGNSSYGIGIESELLARGVASVLKEHVKEIELIRHDEVADWIDQNGWDEVDYRDVGRGVKADKIVAIDLENFRLHEGQTLYSGRANVAVRVLDMTKDGDEVFRRNLPEIKFPANGAYHATETTEAAFRKAFLQTIAEQVGHYFYEYDMAENYGRDPASLG